MDLLCFQYQKRTMAMNTQRKVIPLINNPLSLKILPLGELSKKVAKFKLEKKTVVHCHGVFDLLHIGHIRYFEQARRMGDILIVTLTPDGYVDKGPHRPAFEETLRAEAVASLNCVDFVAINQWPTAEETLKMLKPDIYVKGSEYRDISSDMTGKIAKEAKIVSEIGAALKFTDDIVFSSTNLINRYLSNFPDKIRKYLDLFRKRYTLDEVLGYIDRMADLDVTVIGDTIIDEYQYCSALGKSSKDPILAFHYHSKDIFAGGVLAVANHLASFTNSVNLITALGERDSYEAFITPQLHPKVTPHFLTKPGAPTTLKRRFIEGYTLNKLFEVYIMDDTDLPDAIDSKLRQIIQNTLDKDDLVVVADFGHGLINKDTAKFLSDVSPFLAVNAQANAGNRGFHTVTRYPKADFISLAEHEIRLETRDVSSGLQKLILKTRGHINCDCMAVTKGKEGCIISSEDGDFIEVPSFTQHIVDRVGAGDSFYSVSALAASLKIPVEIIAFLGNVAGSLAVEILGNKKSIDKDDLKKFIVSLLK